MLQTCSHLQALEQALRDSSIPIQYEGKSWWGRSRGTWLYFQCFLDDASLRRRFGLPEFVSYSEYDGHVAGQEAGFVCSSCESAIMGVHRDYAQNLSVFR